jgi:putative membrane protein
MAEKHPVRGVLAGVAGGLLAAWVMNEWSAGPGAALNKQLETPEEQKQVEANSGGEDATMKTADALATVAQGGQHLTQEQKEAGGPIVHYTYAALVGGLYGGLAEYSSLVRSGFGTTYGAALFVGGDLIAVPALGLSRPLSDFPPSSFAGPLSAHLVYGLTTELVRRIARAIL